MHLYCLASSCKIFSLQPQFVHSDLLDYSYNSEGIATVLIAPMTPFLLTDDILGAKWLNTDERRYLTKRIKYDRMGKDKGPFQWKYLHQAFRDWKTWAYGMTFFGGGLSTYGMSFALPTIIRQLGYTNANAQLMTIPVYFAAFLMVSTGKPRRYTFAKSLLSRHLSLHTFKTRLEGVSDTSSFHVGASSQGNKHQLTSGGI